MQSMPIDPHQELADAPLTSFHWRLAGLMTLLTLFDGYDTFNPAYVIHYVVQPWGLVPSQVGFLVSSGLIGFLIGAAGHGVIADRFGRRVTLLAGLWIASLFTLATPIVGHDFLSFCIVRLLTGVGLGVLLPLATTYITELAPRRNANTFVLFGVALGWAAGGVAASLVGIFVTPVFGWQSLYWAGSLSFILLAGLHATLPESIQFLALRGRDGELRTLLARLRPDRAALYAVAEIRHETAKNETAGLASLLAPRYRRTSLTIWSVAFLSLFCVFGLTGWVPTVMLQRGESFVSSFGFGALMQIMSFLGGLACGSLADRFGRAPAFLSLSWFCGGLAVLSLAFFDLHAANVAGVAAAGFFIIGAQFILNNFTAQSYDTSVRASAVGMELGIGRIGAILGPFVVGVVQQVFPGPQMMFCVIGLAAITASALILTLSERKRRVLDVVKAPA